MRKYPAMIRELEPEEGEGFLVEILDLPGCIADGKTEEEALKNAGEAILEWIATATALDRPVPEPKSIEHYSGKWLQRVPKSLHMKLAQTAKREGVSLNALATSMLAESLGHRTPA